MADMNRFAVSLLSRSNKADALPEEVLIHKGTGEVLVKTPDGNVISYNKLSRRRNHVDFVSLLADNLALTGDMFSLQLDGIEYPDFITENVNLIGATPIEIKSSNLKRILLSLDLDCIEINGIDSITTQFEPTVEVDVALVNASDVTQGTFKVSLSLGDFNRKVIDPSVYLSSLSNLETYKAKITSLKVIRHANNASKTMRNILHGVLLIVE